MMLVFTLKKQIHYKLVILVLLQFCLYDYIVPHGFISGTLVMLDHPKETAAVVGDTVTLCCQASGQPPPQHFDWLDILIPTTICACICL